MAVQIQLRRDTASNWSTANPILAQAELGIEIDTNRIKIGDGVNDWNSISYFGNDFPEWSERENNTVLFDQKYIIGNAAARTGNILFDFTGAKLGAETEMRHADASAFTFPDEAMLMFDVGDISTTDDNYFLFVLTNKTIGSEVVKVFHALEGGL